MKNLLKTIILLFAVTLFISCDNEMEDHVTGDASEGGALVSFSSDSEGKLLGMPLATDLSTASVAFSDSELNITAILNTGGQNVAKYEIVKSFNGGAESVVASANELPLTLTYTTVDDYLSGTSVSDVNDLRIGDQFVFKIKMYASNGTFSSAVKSVIKVGCSSNLAFDYAVTCNRPSDGASWDQGIETISEKGVGVYKTGTTGGWAINAIAPDQGFDFEDLCNELTVADQGLAQGYYSNKVYQTDDQAANSYVDADTGNMYIEYTISFGSGDRAYINEYIKQ